MTRHLWVLIHRWVGLTMAGFLILVGLTGSLLAFKQEIDHALTPNLFPKTSASHALKLDQLALAAQDLLPTADVKSVFIDASGSALVSIKPKTDPVSKKPYVLGYNQLIIDAETGQELGRRTIGLEGWPNRLDNLVPFIYRLHFSLALGETGNKALGIVALLWTIDCFVSLYLTLPTTRKLRNTKDSITVQKRRSFWRRWKPAWLVKWSASAIRVNFDLHRAGGLWLWIMLLVFAWSSVAYNLHKEVYEPVMRIFFEMPESPLKTKPPTNATPLGWHEALTVAERLMQEQAEHHHFTVVEPLVLNRATELGLYVYRVRSSLDVQITNGMTFVYFDMYNGQLQRVRLPTTQHSGETAYTWLKALHDANVFGLPYRILVCVLGLVIVMLSITGVVIWLRKRRARKLPVKPARFYNI